MAGSVKLKVQEAVQDDINKGIVKIDSSYLHNIGVKPGDVVELKGERSTVAIADRAYPGDIGLSIIRMDGITRRNTRSSIGEQVEVKKATVKEAKKVIIAPAQKGVIIKASPQLFKQGLLGRPVIKGDIVSLGGSSRRRSAMGGSPLFNDVFNELGRSGFGGFGFSDIKFIVADASPKGAVIISDMTEVVFNPEAIEIKEDKLIDVSYEDVGGLSEEIKKVREMVELPLKHPEIFESLGIEPPKGVLLHGPPGTGKTLLAKAVATETASHFILINGPEIMSKFYGQSEANLRKKFEEAEKNSPAIIFIDEIDAIAPKREESYGEVEKRVVAQLLGMMDGLKSRGKVVVIAATNIPDAVDPALRRPGRFDREIEVGVPNSDARLGILKIHTRNMPLDTDPKTLDQNLDIEGIRKVLINVLTHVKTDDIVAIAKPILAGISSANRDPSYDKLKKEVNAYLNKIYSKQQTIKSRGYFIEECLNAVTTEIRDSFMRVGSESELEDKIKEFIEKIKSDIDHLISVTVKEKMLSDLAHVTVGFVGADLNALTKEAAMVVLRRLLPELKLKEDEPLPKDILKKLKISMEDFKEALKVVRPSAMREVLVDIPNIKWSDVGGLKEVKQELREAIEWPLKYKSSFDRLGVRPPQGVLMYGPPGTGKTLLAKAAANEANANFIPVKGPELLSKWMGESEKAVRKIFKKARQMAPSIIFFDEIDSIVPVRSSGDSSVTERVVNQLLTEMDGLENLEDVVVMAATNRPDMIDTALLRPGRFDRIILCPVPDEEAREKIFKIHTKNMQIDFASANLIGKNVNSDSDKKKGKEAFYKKLAKLSEGYVGADIEAVCREAAMLALRDDIETKEIKFDYFKKALEKVYPSTTKEIQKTYENLKTQFSKARAKQMEEDKPNYYG